MLERCTDGAKNALRIAGPADAHGHERLNEVQLLIGVLEDSEGAARVLQAANIDPARIRIEAKKILPRETETSESAEIKAAIVAAVAESQRRCHAVIATEHLLFGLLTIESGALNRILADLGIGRRRLDSELSARLSRFSTASKCGRRKAPELLPRTIGGRMAVGVASLLPLLFGSLGCWLCIIDPPGAAGQNGNDVGDIVSHAIVFELSALVALTAAAGLLWAIAAPKWLERILEALARKTWFLLMFLAVAGILLILGCVLFVVFK